MRRYLALALSSLSLSFAAFAVPPSQQYELALPGPDATLEVPAVDHEKALAEDAAMADEHVPLRYAIASHHAVDAHGAAGKSTTGAWQALPDGRVAWRLAVRSPGALSLDVGFDRMFLPRGAALYVASLDGKTVHGPYTEADHTPFGGFWTPYVPGDVALIEAVMPAAMQPHFDLKLTTVHSAYRDLEGDMPSLAKLAGSCNVDVACPAANPYRDQQRAVARYTFGGSICTGQLVNNTAGDGKRYFISANHCADSQSDVNSLVVYWKYEHPTCRTPRTAANAVPLPVDGNSIPQTGGATLRMTHEPPDTTLLELNTAIPAAAEPFFDGWDRRDVPPTSGVVIHHPQGEEKRIAIENDPLQIINVPSGVPGTRHFRVVDYDLGTTEVGSSGSGLLNPDKRLIGVLSGGAAACGSPSSDSDNDGDNDGDDYFGRLSVAWEGGGTPATRLRDWLDPGNSGAQVLDGGGGCVAPTVVLNGPATVAAGVPAAFGLALSGGQAPFTVAWDIDGDGVTDRTSIASSTGASISPVYPNGQTVTVVARVTDSAGCGAQAQRALVVTAPSVAATTAGTPLQVCGDGDAAIEPGERFRIPVRVTNEGAQAMQSGFAVFARGQAAAAGAPYVQADSTAGATCPFQFVDISSAAALSLTASDEGFPATDDGRTGALPLPGGPIDFFGETVSSLVMSTNGYLSTGADESGGDYDNTCPIDTPDRGSTGGRFNVLHDDLAVLAGGGLRTQYFPSCPRAGNSGSGPRGCTVFQWNNLARVTGGGSDREGNFTMQAILYDGTNQVVYQYQSADPLGGGSATIGIQNTGNTVRAQYACNETNRIAAGRAVCFFHPAAPPGAADPARIRLLTPAVALGDLGAGQQATVEAQIEVDPATSCGAPLRLDYVGAVDNVAHTLRRTRVLDTTVGGGNSACQTFTGTCPSTAGFAKQDGLYSSLVRFGNGMGAFNIPVPGGTVFGGQWYTGRRDRTPEWLILQGPIVDNQADVPVYRFRQTGTNPFAVASTIVGRAQISYTSSTDYIATWIVDGVPAGEKLTLLYGSNRPTPNRTGSWFPPSESGWGLAVDDHFLPNGQAEQVIVNYFYDAASNPVWTLGGGPVGGGTQPHNLFRVHCPSCPSLPDLLNDIRPAGSVTANYTGLTTGTYSTVITFPPPLSGSWFRNNLPIQMISPPQAPSADDDASGTARGSGAGPAPVATRPGPYRGPTTRSRTREVIR